jgi:RNA polymerase-binding transcription factor DksA
MSLSASLKQAANTPPVPEKIPEGYDPRHDRGEYMNPVMRAFFYQLLKERLQEKVDEIDQYNKAFREKEHHTDMADRANAITYENIAQTRINSLKKVRDKITQTIQHFEKDPSFAYGYDRDGEEIGADRLMAIPWATTTADEKDRSNRQNFTSGPLARRAY